VSAPQLRPATPLDAGAVGGILSAFIDETPWMPRIHTRAEDLAHADALIAHGWVTVATLDRRVRGFLAQDGATIHALYIHKDARGSGIGAALLDHAMTQNAELELWTFEANTGAQRFYERAGFTLAERTDGSSNDEGLPDRRYVWAASTVRTLLPSERTA
jgi:GNAT superfamily N-acetyltransferase